MTTWGRRTVLGGLLATVVCCGCDVGSIMYFLMPEPKTDPELRRLASDEKSKEPRVVILVSPRGMETRAELIQADRQLAELLAKQLRELCAKNDERLAIVAPRKVEEFKSGHPRWQALDPRDIGRQFKADYVIDLEIDSISLFEKGTRELFRGQIELHLALIEVNKPDEVPERRELSYLYPSEAKSAVPVGFDASPQQFRQSFLTFVAKRLAWNFTGHPPLESYDLE